MKVDVDIDVKQNVTDELKWEPSVDAASINVVVDQGTVILSGKVPTYYEKFSAEEAASRVRGVKTVVNDISVELKGDNERSDEEIMEAVVDALTWDTTVPEERINVTVEEGFVTLDGTVTWNFQKLNATDAIRYLAGVRGITNKVAIEPTAEFVRPAERIERAMERSGLVDGNRIKFSIEGSKAVLKGTVPTWDERRNAERIAWSTPGIYDVENKISIDFRL